MPSLCKHHLDTADAKRPKHHLDTSRKPPKPQAKKLFHVTFGIPINNLWSHRAHAQPMQTPSGHCRCKKTQTPSRHEPKTAQTASQKTVSRYLWNPHKQSLEPQSTCPAYANTSLCKHHLDTADAKRPKHHLDTSRKPPKPQAKKLFHVTFGIPINNLWSHRAHAQPMQTPSGHCRCKKTQTPSRHEPKTAQTASQKTVSRYLWNPHKQSLEPQSTCPAYANTIWTLQMQKDPNTI